MSGPKWTKPYCRPLQAGIESQADHVARRIGKLIYALETHINGWVVEGPILKDLSELRQGLIDKLRDDGWSINYRDLDGPPKVRYPGQPARKRKITNKMVEDLV